VRVAPKHMAGAHRSARERGKSDSIDAFSVARAALREGLETLPGAHLDGAALDIRLLSDHRDDDLVKARTQDQQRLRWHLHDLWPEFEIPSGALDNGKWLGKVSRRPSPAPSRPPECGLRAIWCARSPRALPASASSSQSSPDSSPAMRRSCSPSPAAVP
jgi:Transposase